VQFKLIFKVYKSD